MALSGLTINSVTERPALLPGGTIGTEVVISITTDLGNTGTLVMKKAEYEKLEDDQLAEAIAKKAAMLDRAHFL